MISPHFIETLPVGIPAGSVFFAAPATRCGDDLYLELRENIAQAVMNDQVRIAVKRRGFPVQ